MPGEAEKALSESHFMVASFSRRLPSYIDMVFVVEWKATFSSPDHASVASMPPRLSNLQWKAFARLRSVSDQHLNEPSGNWSGEGRCQVIK